MDTKWKNMVKAIKKFIKEYYDCVFGSLLFIIGSFLFFVVLVNRYYFSTWGVMENLPDRQYPGAAGNLPARTQVYETEISELESERDCRDLSAGCRRQYLLSDLEGERKTVGKRFRNILAVELSAAAAYLFFISYSSGWGWNYAAGYMMVATVFIEYICCREVIQRYWRNELDQIMEQTESFFQKRLEQALEIERKSLEKVSRSDQLRVDLITNVSHDLKTPLFHRRISGTDQKRRIK